MTKAERSEGWRGGGGGDNQCDVREVQGIKISRDKVKEREICIKRKPRDSRIRFLRLFYSCETLLTEKVAAREAPVSPPLCPEGAEMVR